MPPPALAAALRRAPGSGADGGGKQRPRQPGAKAMAAGVRGHRGLAARCGQGGPRRRPHDSARPALARLVGPGPGHELAADAGAREGASKPGRVTGARARAPSLAARGPLRGRERGQRERPAGMALSSSLRDTSSLPLPQPPSPPPPGSSSPAEPRPPAALTLHCDPQGGGAGAGAGPPGSTPPSRRSRGGAGKRHAGRASELPLRQVARRLPLTLQSFQPRPEGSVRLCALGLSDCWVSELLQDQTFSC